MLKNLFQQNQYIVIKNAVSQETCKLLSDYTTMKVRVKPNMRKGDALNGVHREYGDILMETLLAHLTPTIEKATGLDLWPTLSFYYNYQHGHRLDAHKDRSSCQIVAGLCIDADDNYKKNSGSWPLIIKINGEALPIELDYGDLLIFYGHETEHWRDKFTGDWFVSAIFGYVEKNGPFYYQRYDQRKSLGHPHIGMFRWLWREGLETIKRKIKLRGTDGAEHSI